MHHGTYNPLAVLKIKDSGTKVETLTSECTWYPELNHFKVCFHLRQWREGGWNTHTHTHTHGGGRARQRERTDKFWLPGGGPWRVKHIFTCFSSCLYFVLGLYCCRTRNTYDLFKIVLIHPEIVPHALRSDAWSINVILPTRLFLCCVTAGSWILETLRDSVHTSSPIQGDSSPYVQRCGTQMPNGILSEIWRAGADPDQLRPGHRSP